MAQPESEGEPMAASSLRSGSDEAFWDFGGAGEQRLPVEPLGGQGIDEQVERLGWSGVAGLAGVGGQHHAVVANSGDEGSQARGVERATRFLLSSRRGAVIIEIDGGAEAPTFPNDTPYL